MVNPTQLLDSLDAEEIRRRLQTLDAEEKALRVLLRAALARNRVERIPNGSEQQAGDNGGQR